MGQEDHKLAAIVFTDIVGYTKQMEENEFRTMQLLQKQREILFPLVKTYKGEVIKELGDGLMMMFNSAVEAVRFAISAQLTLKDEELTIRAGIHIGDVIFKDGDVFGSAVNTAARIEPLATPNGICISEDVKSQLQNKTDIETIHLGKKELKGVSEPVNIYEVFIEGITKRPKKDFAYFVKDLWNRAVIQIMLGYLASAWIIRLAVSAIVDRYLLSTHLVDLTWVILVSLIPAVFLLTYYHGRRKTSSWTKAEMIGLPANLIFTIVLSVFLFQGKDLGAATTTLTVENEKGETITRTVLKGEFRKKIVPFAFENINNDTALNWLQYGLATMLTYDLSQDLLVDVTNSLSYIEKFSEFGFDDGLNTPLMLKKKVANYYHKNYFTTGGYQFDKGIWKVSLDVYDSEKGNVIGTYNFENADLMALVDEMTAKIKIAVGMPEQHIASTTDLQLEEVTTHSLEAFKYYNESLNEIAINHNWSKGVNLAEKALEIDEDFAVAHLTTAEFYFNSNMPEKARSSLDVTVNKLSYKLPERNLFYAKFFYYLVDQKADQANKVIKMWTELYPEDVNARIMMAQRYLMKNEFDLAIEQYKTILEIVPEEYEYLKLTGDIYELAGKFDSSLYFYQQYARYFPNDFISFQNLGDSYRKLGNFKKARESFERAQIIDPSKMSVVEKLVGIDRREGKIDDAFQRLEEAYPNCKTANDSVSIISAYKSVYELIGQIQQSFDYSQQLFAIYDRIMPPLRQMVFRIFLISQYNEVGRSAEAFELIQKIEAEFQPPFDKVAAFGYLFYYIEMEQPEKAKAHVDDALALIEGFGEQTLLPNIYWAEGKIAEMEGNWELAIEKYKLYGDIKKGEMLTHRWLSRCYRENGDYKEAEKHIEKPCVYTLLAQKIFMKQVCLKVQKAIKTKHLNT